jgi:hypothetical protein
MTEAFRLGGAWSRTVRRLKTDGRDQGIQRNALRVKRQGTSARWGWVTAQTDTVLLFLRAPIGFCHIDTDDVHSR